MKRNVRYTLEQYIQIIRKYYGNDYLKRKAGSVEDRKKFETPRNGRSTENIAAIEQAGV